MSQRPTEEQQAAIAARGKVIVSASAGSGKTFVMIERLVSVIVGGVDVREVLAVTYTNKAAAQMREKLRSALVRAVGENTEPAVRARLKQQLAALPLADICTMHVFCARLLRTYFYMEDLDPAFRIVGGEDAECRACSSRALDEIFEEAYRAPDDGFRALLAFYYRKKSDRLLREAVLKMNETIKSDSDPEARLREAGRLSFPAVTAALWEGYRDRISRLLGETEALSPCFAENKRGKELCAALSERMTALLSEPSLTEAVSRARAEEKLPRAPEVTKAEGEELSRILRLKAVSAAWKEILKALSAVDEEGERIRHEEASARTRALAALVLAYRARFRDLKREAGFLDYDDLEHGALRLLRREDVRDAVRKKYRYIFVDEYQDVNLVQEELLGLAGGEEVFLVGDAKQAIYAFRGSRSKYFLEKTRSFPVSLVLSESFRSAPNVIEAVNEVFSYAMTEETCGLGYAAEARMRGGARYGGHRGEVRCLVLPEREKREKAQRGVYSVLDPVPEGEGDRMAELVAETVRKEVGRKWFDADLGCERPVTYGDIAVLTRMRSGAAERAVRALSAAGIPVAATAEVNVCDFWEAKLLLDWLSYLDNAEQDIPMAGAMLSYPGGLTENDLAAVRGRFLFAPSFRAACREYAEKLEDTVALRLRAFFGRAERYRLLARVRSAREMIGVLLADGLEAEILAQEEGELRLRRVLRLAETAEGSVNAFLLALRASGNEVKFCESGGENAVKVLTMHASKGLEYPVVILMDLDRPFHGADRKEEFFYADGLSFAPKGFDPETRSTAETLHRDLIAQKIVAEERRSELNLLYVAMTRAKERLYLLFSAPSGSVPLSEAKRFADFIPESFLKEKSGPLPAEELPPRAEALAPAPEEERELSAVYGMPYAFSKSVALPVKSSATKLLELVRGGAEETPSGHGHSAEEGIAYHAFLQHVRFGAGVGEELVRMRAEGLLSEEQLALLNEEKLRRILALPSLREAAAGGRVLREQTFLLSLTAREAGIAETDDLIVFQGAVDLLAETPKGWLLLDYKFSSRSDDALRSGYAPQIVLYKKAVAKAMRVSEDTVRARILNIALCREIGMD